MVRGLGPYRVVRARSERWDGKVVRIVEGSVDGRYWLTIDAWVEETGDRVVVRGGVEIGGGGVEVVRGEN